jgi:hypothetical protein
MVKSDEEEGAPNALNMSDEDFLKADPSTFDGTVDSGESDDDDSTDDAPKTAEEIESARRDALSDEERAAEDAHDESDDDGGDDDPEKDTSGADEFTDTAETSAAESARREGLTDEERAAEDADEAKGKLDDNKGKDDKPSVGELTDDQYVDIGKQVMAEFKANGTTMKVKSVDDAMQLMQMGANYHKKMAGLKPSLKTLKLLENNGLLEPEKINFLIDLNNKKPEAITQLLKDGKIDPLTINTEDEGDYTPEQHTVSDKELVLDEVLESINTDPNYNKTLNVLGTVWDDDSRRAISADPAIIRTVNAHMGNGIYDQVAASVAYERSLGKLQGVSDLEAYQQVGAHMHANKLFKATAGTKVDKPDRQDNQPRNNAPNADNEMERTQRKKAAAPSRRKQSPTNKDENFNPLAMSDEEFVKLNKMSF